MQRIDGPGRGKARAWLAVAAAGAAALAGWTLLRETPVSPPVDDRVRVIPAGPAGDAPAVATGAGIALHAVFVGGTPAASSARLSADGHEATFRIGEAVVPGVTLAAVAHDHVMLEEAGAQRPLYLLAARTAGTAARQGLDPEPVAPSGELDGATQEARIRAASGPVVKTPEEIAAGR